MTSYDLKRILASHIGISIFQTSFASIAIFFCMWWMLPLNYEFMDSPNRML